jgi:hypothetical protein
MDLSSTRPIRVLFILHAVEPDFAAARAPADKVDGKPPVDASKNADRPD